MHGAEAAAVVACGDAQNARDAGRANADAHRFLDGILIHAVDDDLVDGIDAIGKGGFDDAAQGRAVGVVGASLELLVLAADLAPAAHDAAGEGEKHAGDFAYRDHGGLGSGEAFRLTGGEDQKVAAADAFDSAEDVFADEFAVHDGEAPIAAVFEFLADLMAVAEEAQIAADAKRLAFDDRQSIVASSGSAGEDTLPDTTDDGLLQRVPAEAEHQHADAGPAVHGFLGTQRSLHAGLDVTANDRGSITRDDLPRDLGPLRRFGGDDESRRRHRECLGERVFDLDVIDGEQVRSILAVDGSCFCIW